MDYKKNYSLKGMRECVRDAFEKGVTDEETFRKMRHAIICEMKLLGINKAKIKMALIEWNKKNKPKLSPNETKRQLNDYVDWSFKKDTKISCKALKDYCIDKGRFCEYRKKTKRESQQIPFDFLEAVTFLENRYGAEGFELVKILRTIIKIKKFKDAKWVLFVGLREIQAQLMDTERWNVDLMTISRRLYKLETIGFIKITRGEKGSFGNKKANAYEFISWSVPRNTEKLRT